MRYVYLLVATLLLTTIGHSATIYVPDDYGTIQGAIDASSTGDTIIVRTGTYVENIDFVGEAITVVSESGPGSTVIDGNDSGSVVSFKNGEGPDSLLEGFTVTNGSGQSDPDGRYSGGGIYCESSSPTITDNLITGNDAPDGGGGMYAWFSDPIVTRCTFESNGANYGGGMYNSNSDPLVTRCTFHLNNATGRGGGMHNQDSEPTSIDCVFTYNTTDYRGGGISNAGSKIELINCAFIGNHADADGGGIYSFFSDFTAINCTFNGNDASNQGGGLFNHTSSPTATNCILWGNNPEEIVDYNNSNSVVTHCCVQGGYAGTGNIDVDPLLADPGIADIHLTSESPCRDAGDNYVVTEPSDFEGDPRLALGTVDMGADEHYYHLYHVGDVVPGSPIEIKVVGYPTAPILLALGSGIQDPPLSTQHGDLWLQLPLLWQGTIGTVPGNGILVLSTTVPTGWAPGSEHPLQALVGPWGGPWTWLTNAEVLVVE